MVANIAAPREAPLRALLKRGALLAAANWPLVLVQFAADSVFKMVVAIPLFGGILLVALGMGGGVDQLLGGDAQTLVTIVGRALVEQPVSLVTFCLALTVVILGGSVLMFLVKGGTVTVLATAERHAGPIHHHPLRLQALKEASWFSVQLFQDGCRRLFGRYVVLGLCLLAAYGLTAALYLTVVLAAYRGPNSSMTALSGAVLTVASSLLLVVWITVINLLYLLIQMTIAVENSGVLAGIRAALRFLQQKLGHVLMIVGVVFVLFALALLASVVATGSFGIMAFIPVVGLAVIVLQFMAWLVRGLAFQYLGLAALGSYLTLYSGRYSHD